MRARPKINVAVSVLVLIGTSLHAQHGHLNGGALGQNPGDRLYFANGDLFAASSGYVKELVPADTGRYAGLFEGNISLTALPTTVANGGPVPSAPAPGSFIMTGLVSVQGPAGGAFAFWEEAGDEPSVQYDSGWSAPTPTTLWALSDASLGAGNAGSDPFGHLHGRRFTVNLAGDYTVGFKLFDTSANGAGGGPIHLPSETLMIRFSTIPEPAVGGLLCVGAVLLAWRARCRR